MAGKTTQRAEFVRNKVKENNGKLSKNALAKLLFDAYPNLFKDKEHARSCVRFATGNAGENNRNASIKVEWEIPEGDSYEYEDFILPQSASNLLILSDVHFPYHTVNSLENALNEGIKQGCNSILLMVIA